MSEKAVRDAAVAVLSAAACHPLTLDEIKQLVGTLPDYYNELVVTDRFGGVSRLSVFVGTGGYRILMRSVGKTEDAALVMRARGRAALEYASLDVGGGVTSTPVQFESADAIAEDDPGWWSGLMTLTTTL